MIPCGICVHMFICACACMHVCVCLCQLWHNDRLTVGATTPPRASRKAYIPGLRAVNVSTDYRLKHAARSHQCFSQYSQSQCLEIIASGQGWDLISKTSVVVVVQFY